jgi:predicted MFS family arabinose efflux permease
MTDRSAAGRRTGTVLVYLAGVVAAAALGRYGPLGTDLRADLGLSLADVGWLTSIITVVAATLALPTSMWVRRRDAYTALATGLAVLSCAGALEILAPNAAVLYTVRVVEGVGYLLVVVTGPGLIARVAGPIHERAALALWSTFIPVGLAFAASVGPLVPALGWRGAAGLTVLATAAVAVLAAVAAARLRSGDTITALTAGWSARSAKPPARTMLLALAFSIVALLGVTVITLLPSLADANGFSATGRGVLTVTAALASIPGGLLAGLLLQRGWHMVSALTALVMPLSAVLVFTWAPWWAVSTGAGLFLLSNGLVLAAMYAAVPGLVHTPDQLPLAYGLLVQIGSLGTLFGPPLFGALVTTAGWSNAVTLVAACTATGLGLFLAAVRNPVESAGRPR